MHHFRKRSATSAVASRPSTSRENTKVLLSSCLKTYDFVTAVILISQDYPIVKI